ncbi:hypothetical protein [Leucothrix arctica]|uniref:Uncharacterized protein n=1 Tax=Leucothrix arctica TaxID=1481894 RepID=A0A317CQ19_9GAMM|nr:hypothetical protein [Leucothrix arctica]PWQ98490.1 hypothetical protein DKT75_03295 [Leucothrix arctica]
MTLKSIIWTIIIAVCVFFAAIYFGMKYNWVEDAEPKLSISDSVKQSDTTGSVSLEKAPLFTPDKNAKIPELIDEPIATDKNPISLGSLDLTIEDIVSECQSLTQSVGIPEAQIEQATMECINRNSAHLTQNEPDVDDKYMAVLEECESAISQLESLSQEEIKMLVDECVASSE